MNETNPYHYLSTQETTPADEVCGCAKVTAINLRDTLSRNPLTCGTCMGEVAPERINLPHKLAQPIAQWRELYHAHWTLWLDSGMYEGWATARLVDPRGDVHVRGMELGRSLSVTTIPAFYRWFSFNNDFPPRHCPF